MRATRSGRRRIARTSAGLAAVAAIAAIASSTGCDRNRLQPASEQWHAGTHEHSVVVQSDERSFLLHVPAAARRNRIGVTVGYPLVILLHGSGADGETIRAQSGMDGLADSLRFVVAYPNGATRFFGLGSDWNAGKCCGNAARNNVDDVGFVRGIVAEASRHLPIDRRRVFVAGFSDGGRMAYRIGCEASDLVGAIGVVSGSLVDERCAPPRAVPLIAFHGTADDEVSYGEAPASRAAAPLLAASASLPPSVRYWAAQNGCKRLTLRRESPHVMRSQFAGCGADVLFYSIEGGGHAWPGGARDGASGAVPTPELRASTAMVGFFLRHPLR